MRQFYARARQRRRGRGEGEVVAPLPNAATRIPAYARASGVAPALALQRPPADSRLEESPPSDKPSAISDREEPESGVKQKEAFEGKEEKPASISPIVETSGKGRESRAVNFGLALKGRTDATYDGGTFRATNVKMTPTTGCSDCEGPCVKVTGILESTFKVTTVVTLPSVADFPDLTPCQRAHVQSAITNVLRPHEQKHVEAFRKYNGVVRQPFTFTCCQTEAQTQLDTIGQEMHNQTEQTRRATAQDASNALDPFQFEVDMDCEDKPKQPPTP